MDYIFDTAVSHSDTNSSDSDDFPRSMEYVWILGRKYDLARERDQMRADIRTRLWLTYRKGYVPIGDSGLTSDKGWGCMLRCGQMVMAQALIHLHLGRDWRWKKDSKEPEYLRILRMFEDRRTATYSIHQIARMGIAEGKLVGEWFGPNTVAQVLKKLCEYDNWSSMTVHVALDNALVISEIKTQCLHVNAERHRTRWKPLILIIPLRLGLAEINPVYVRGLKTCFTFRQSVGVIGGKPNHALYFIGTIGDQVIYLDPHTTQQVNFVSNKEHSQEKSADLTYHCSKACRCPILSMDPSVAVCFFCPTETEFDILCQQINERLIKTEKQPLFEINQNKPRGWSPLDDSAIDALELCDLERSNDNSDEDFVFLG